MNRRHTSILGGVAGGIYGHARVKSQLSRKKAGADLGGRVLGILRNAHSGGKAETCATSRVSKSVERRFRSKLRGGENKKPLKTYAEERLGRICAAGGAGRPKDSPGLAETFQSS